jgi:hypothetical protein
MSAKAWVVISSTGVLLPGKSFNIAEAARVSKGEYCVLPGDGLNTSNSAAIFLPDHSSGPVGIGWTAEVASEPGAGKDASTAPSRYPCRHHRQPHRRRFRFMVP